MQMQERRRTDEKGRHVESADEKEAERVWGEAREKAREEFAASLRRRLAK